MSFLLIVIGLLLVCLGTAVIVAGAPEWALGLGLGASLIESGTIGFVGGLVIFGIGLLLRAVGDLGRRLDALKTAAKSAQAARAPVEHAPIERAPEIEPSIVPQQIPVPPTQPVARPPHPSARPVSADEKDLRPRAWPPSTGATGRTQGEPAPRVREPAPERAMREIPAPKPEPAPAPKPPAPVPVTDAAPAGPAVRSGIIGGMAYTLYADGSIEAELPLGTMRFASIEDLRAHVSRTGADADAEFRKPATKP
ncbi:MAG TPA: hypothetical protein VIG34_04275 [Xanthobacteraceae bacterium]|jgi:hypothetical protein